MTKKQMTKERMLHIASVRLYHHWQKLYPGKFKQKKPAKKFVEDQHAAHTKLTFYILTGAKAGERLEAFLIACDTQEIHLLVSKDATVPTMMDEIDLLIEKSKKLVAQIP